MRSGRLLPDIDVEISKLVGKMPFAFSNFMILLIIILAIDAIVSNIADFIVDQLISPLGIALFVAVVIVTTIGQLLILGHIRRIVSEILSRSKNISNLQAGISTMQWFQISVIAFVVGEVILVGNYHTLSLSIVTSVSYALAIGVLILLCIRFFVWAKENKSFILILYGVASLGLAVMSLSAVLLMDYLILTKPSQVNSSSPVIYPSFDTGSIENSLSDFYVVADIISFILVWSGSALILKHYSKKLGALRYWIIVGLPLIYFSSNFYDLIPGFEFFDDFSLIVITTLNSSAGGILFGIVFWIASRGIGENSAVKDYLKVCAFGFILWFTCNQASLIAASYPPFGIAAVSTMGIAAYLIFIGLFCSAVSISQDDLVRRSVLKSTTRELKLVGDIGYSQMYSDIKKRIVVAEKANLDKMVDDTGISSSLTQDDIESYMKQVIDEVKGKK
jgi:hypothetical protein